ncbi:helix-turn-helix transcriptional regulator [Sphingomonas sp. LB-2]|uniref:response regulator transcription factor n=1 Tax=Sphingomonas caeni TaxID=2984949 RepID=UPI00222F5B2E|nr:helix-turn-helix transcriptional regulator [Sphingomonas caeni]MCW3846319.1 helix-turn-helix transcriptional regulator [Sphingomonas caeni]
MVRTILIYAGALAIAALVLQWLEYGRVMRLFSTEFYIVLIAIGFTLLGVWAGHALTARPRRRFERNTAAIAALGLSPRECEILELLASGRTNQQMAEALHISPNTVKTHLARIYEKLEVERRVQAIEKARFLSLIPAA